MKKPHAPDRLTLLSRSQPDLFTGLEEVNTLSAGVAADFGATKSSAMKLSDAEIEKGGAEVVRYVETMHKENKELRNELENMFKKVCFIYC